jgi:hypothetical protein
MIGGEVYCRIAAREGIEAAFLQLPNRYGPGRLRRCDPLFAVASRASLPILVFGSQQILDFGWIEVAG